MADRSVSASTGYGESECVAEQLLEHAARAFGQSIMVLCAGQICGPTQGRDDERKYEWLPSLVTSSRYRGAILASLSGHFTGSTIDWCRSTVLPMCSWSRHSMRSSIPANGSQTAPKEPRSSM